LISNISTRRIFLRGFFVLSTAALLLTSCTTSPVLPEESADPIGLLPSAEDYYLLARPAQHPALTAEFLGLMVEVDSTKLNAVMERCESALFSGRFASPESETGISKLPPLSGLVQGDFPAFFLRSSLRSDKGWEKAKRYVYAGPEGLLCDTAYKDTLLLVSEASRLQPFQEDVRAGQAGINLPEDTAAWWRGGQPALLVYLPDISALPLPNGLPVVPEGSALEMAFLPEDDAYALDLFIHFADSRSARLWSLGMRFFLAGRLGLSPSPEEQAALQTLDLKTEGASLHLSGWTMSSRAWGSFLQSVKN